MLVNLPRRTTTLALITFVLASATSTATAQYSSDFEALEVVVNTVPYAPAVWDATAPAGTAGQDGYYWPAGSTSVPFFAQAYTGGVVTAGINDYGIPDNPSGGAQFIVGNGPASPTFARAQRDMSFSCSNGTWTFATDICATFTGTLPALQNVGSFSAQPFPGGQSFIKLAVWTDPNTATNWNANYIWYDAAGVQVTAVIANPGFQGLNINEWYRWETVVDLATNQVLEVRLTNLTAATATLVDNPVGAYMFGGTTGSATPLTGFRFFAGGGAAGNVLAFDNPSVLPVLASSTSVGAGCFGATLSSNNAGPVSGGAWDMQFGGPGALLSTDLVTVLLKLGTTLPTVSIPAPAYTCATSYVGMGPFVIMNLMTGGTSYNFVLPLPPVPGLVGVRMAAQGVGLDTTANLFFTGTALDAVLGCQ